MLLYQYFGSQVIRRVKNVSTALKDEMTDEMPLVMYHKKLSIRWVLYGKKRYNVYQEMRHINMK